MSFGKETLIAGGSLPFADGGKGRILYARWVADAPDGYKSDDKPIFFKVAIQPVDKNGKDDGDIEICYYTCGATVDDFVPVNSKGREVGFGTDIQKVGTKKGLGEGSKFGILLDNFGEAGLPEDHEGISEDTAELDGLVFDFHRIDEPDWGFKTKSTHPARRRRAREEKEEKQPDRRRTFVVPEKWYEDETGDGADPEEVDEQAGEQRDTRQTEKEDAESGGSRRGGKKTKRGEDSGSSRRSRKAKEADADEDDGDGDEDEKPKRGGSRRGGSKRKEKKGPELDAEGVAREVLEGLLEDTDEFPRKELRRRAFKAIKAREDMDSGSGKEVLALLTSDDFLEAEDAIDGDNISLPPED